MQYNIHEAKTHFSQLLELVAQGETVVIAKNGTPVAELVPYQKKGLQIGDGAEDPLVSLAALREDGWWKAMGEEEVEDFLEGR